MVDWSPIIVDVRRAIQKSSLEVRNGFAVPKTIPEDAVIRVRQITLRIIREITVRFQKLDRLPILSKKNSQAGSQCHLSFNRSIALETVDKFVLRGVGADQPVMQRRCRKNGDWGDVPGVRFVPQSRNESNLVRELWNGDWRVSADSNRKNPRGAFDTIIQPGYQQHADLG